MKERTEILVYITSRPDKVKSGSSLVLHITDEEEKQQTLVDIGRALRANIVQLKNGDYMIISGD